MWDSPITRKVHPIIRGGAHRRFSSYEVYHIITGGSHGRFSCFYICFTSYHRRCSWNVLQPITGGSKYCKVGLRESTTDSPATSLRLSHVGCQPIHMRVSGLSLGLVRVKLELLRWGCDAHIVHMQPQDKSFFKKWCQFRYTSVHWTVNIIFIKAL